MTETDSPRISIIGMGYVGLCTAAVFGSKGLKIIGIDVDQDRVRSIAAGISPFYEPKLDQIIRKTIKTKKLQVTSDIEGIAQTDITFLTVGTPSLPNGSIDLTFVKNAIRETGQILRGKKSYHLVVIKSTVIPGTTTNTVKPLLEKTSQKLVGPELGLCTNPEFLREGSAIQDTVKPDKILAGVYDEKSAMRLLSLYRRLYR